jgi:hypothetical protein
MQGAAIHTATTTTTTTTTTTAAAIVVNTNLGAAMQWHRHACRNRLQMLLHHVQARDDRQDIGA